MKFIFTLTLLTALVFSANSQSSWRITGNYSFGVPLDDMSKNIQPINSLQGGIMYQLPKLKQLSFGFEMGVGSYANKRIDQTFQLDNTTASVVPVNYSSNTFDLNLQTRWNLLSDKNFIVPYISLKGGVYNFFSTIYVDDPTNNGGCHALEQKTLINDKTMYWSAGTGLQINPAAFAKSKKKGNVLIDLSANTIHGGTLDYINTKHLIDAQTAVDPAGKPLQVKFINASTQQIHEHTVAQVYTSPLRLVEFRAGVVLLLN